MRRIRLVVAYDGTAYCGWQRQNNGITIEEVLNRELTALTGEEILVTGASRTDSGVHALGNLAVFDTESRIPAEKFSYALNHRLPADIVVQSSEEVPSDYHPRRCNSLKTYEYRILNRTFPDPTRRLNSYFVHWKLDADRMNEAAGYLLGEHDFVSFCSAGGQAEDTIRKLYEASVRKEEDMIIVRLTGNGFLYNMVRIIVGTLLEVGRGVWEPQKVGEILNARNREQAGKKAPAEGLTLMKITHLSEPEPYVHNQNEWVDYTIWQEHLLQDGRVYMILHACADSEWNRMLARTLRQAGRDHAKEVWVSGLPFMWITSYFSEEDPDLSTIRKEAYEGEIADDAVFVPGLGEIEGWMVFRLKKIIYQQ